MPQVSPRGTYLQVYESLRQKIETGGIAEALPSQAALMNAYDVSRSTIERALSALKSDGVIVSVQDSGWYVAGTGDRRPLVERVTDLLRADGVKVGDRFPTEKELRERFGASRTAHSFDCTMRVTGPRRFWWSLAVPERAVVGLMGWSTTAMAARYQHMVDAVRSDIARQVENLIWSPDGFPGADDA